MERSVPFEAGEYYHVYNRGIEKNPIFFSIKDWHHFQQLLFLRNGEKHVKPTRAQGVPLGNIDRGESIVDICAYALMPNHFHLLIYEKQKGGIASFMHKLLTAYSMYINKKYERSGPLMCRPFRARHVVDDAYLRWLISYIHLNPLDLHLPHWKERGIIDMDDAKEYLLAYQYASFVDHFGESRDEGLILAKESLPIDITDIESIHEMNEILRE